MYTNLYLYSKLQYEIRQTHKQVEKLIHDVQGLRMSCITESPIISVFSFTYEPIDPFEESFDRGLSKESFDKIKKITNPKEKTCSICLSEYKDTDEIRQLDCTHEFHGTCVFNWLSKVNNCPECRCTVGV
jgi:hypothetical protein